MMTRSKRVFTGILFGYGTIGINILFTLGSVPLALHYLSKEEFGLWLLVSQITGYLMLLEFGLSISVSRILADHKDDVSTHHYGNVIKTGNWIFGLQGLLIVIFGFTLGHPLANLLQIPWNLQPPFLLLLGLQATVTALHLSTRTVGAVLWCHQRHDIISISASASFILSFLALWLGFHLGWKIYSLFFSSVVGLIISLSVGIFANRRFHHLPPPEFRGKFEFHVFKQLLKFGSGLFLINAGNQLAAASQIILVSRIMGLDSASTWSIASKMGTMSQTFVSRIFEASSPALSEMSARGETQLLKRRFMDVLTISTAMALAAAAGVTLLNAPLLAIWTNSKISWIPLNDLLLGAFIFLTTITRCYVGMATIMKEIDQVKYACLAEGIVFIGIGYPLTSSFGFTGMLISACIANVFITGIASIHLAVRKFHLGQPFGFLQIAGFFAVLGVLLPLYVVYQSTRQINGNALMHILIGGLILSFLILPTIWKFVLRRESKAEITSRLFRK